MFNDLIHYFIYEAPYLLIYLLTFFYFLLLYFGVGSLFQWCCQWLQRIGLVSKIVDQPVKQKQIKFELWHSFKSIVLFGFSILPIIYFIRTGHIILLENTALNIVIGLVVLNVWNEVHFFLVHRLMHFPFFMRHVHYIHHKSRIPTVYSVYCFHWLEATLLSSVPLIIALMMPFAPLAIALYPLASILLNFAGHCNYRFGNGKGKSWLLFGTNHNDHHAKGKQNFGFASDLLDQIYTKLTK